MLLPGSMAQPFDSVISIRRRLLVLYFAGSRFQRRDQHYTPVAPAEQLVVVRCCESCERCQCCQCCDVVDPASKRENFKPGRRGQLLPTLLAHDCCAVRCCAYEVASPHEPVPHGANLSPSDQHQRFDHAQDPCPSLSTTRISLSLSRTIVPQPRPPLPSLFD